MEIDDTKKVISIKKHSDDLLRRLHRLLQRKVHCDVDIVIGKQSIPVHKIVMVSSSGYFENLIWEKEGDCGELTKVTLNNIDPVTLHWVIHFCYTGEIELTVSSVEKILDAAGYLQVDDLVDECFYYYYQYINTTNCIKIAELAYLYNKTEIWENSFKYCCDHFSKIVKTNNFLSMNFDLLQQLLVSDDIDIPSEKDVFMSLKRWVEYDNYERSRFIPVFINKIRLTILNKEFLKSEVRGFCDKNVECEKSVDEAISTNFSEEVLVSNTRKCFIKALILGGRSSDISSTLEEYNHCTKTWRVIFDIPLFRNTVEFAVVVVENDLILIGGYGDGPETRVIKVNTRNGDVETLAPLILRRSELRAVELNGLIYAIGGYNGDEQVNSMEIYNIERNFWSNGASMNAKRAAFGIAVLNNNVYVAGGHSKDIVALDSVEMYDTVKKIWYFRNPMSKRKNYVEMVASGGYLYTFGGCNGPIQNRNIQCFTEIERYDPNADTWTIVANFEIGRTCLGACSLKNKILIMGGIDDSKNVLSDVFEFIPKSNRLTKLINTNIPRQNPRVISYVRI